MRRTVALGIISLLVLWALWLPSLITLPGYTRLTLTDAGTGRPLFSTVLQDGEPVTLTWTNSLFGLSVTERFVTHNGILLQTEVTFADPRGIAPPMVSPGDVNDLYHTGGAFSAQGLAKPFTRISYRVGEIGDPRLQVDGREIAFRAEVGFGGQVILTVQKVNLYERLVSISPGRSWQA